MRGGSALLACALALPAAAEQRSPWEARIEAAHESLDHGYADWRELLGQLTYRPAPKQAYFAGLRETERYGLTDREAIAGAYLPLGGGGPTLHLEATASPTHLVLPRGTFLAELAQPLGEGWMVSGAAKATRYPASDVRTAVATLEKYAGNWRYAYTLYLSKPDFAGWAPTHRLVAAWYRSELTQAALSVARGREVENVVPLGLLTSDVRNVTFTAGYEVAPRWGLGVEWGWHRQGDLYTRRSLRVGTRFLF